LHWNLDHLIDGADVDAWLRDFPNAPEESTFWRIKDDLNLPERVEFDAIGEVFETIDYPYTDVRWPIMSKRMLETLLSVGDFNHRAYPLVMVDCEVIDYAEDSSPIKSSIEYHNFFVVQILEDLDIFDWDNSVYTRDSEAPQVLDSVQKLALKEPAGGFPPLFRVITSYLKTNFYISAEARTALEIAGIRGVNFIQSENDYTLVSALPLGIAGLDAGLRPEVVTQVVKLPGVAKAAMSMTKAQGKVFVASLGRIEGEVTDAVVQRIATAARKADAATTMIVDNGDGTLTAVRPLGKAADKVDDVAAKSASRRSAPKAFDAYENAPTVKPFIGTKVDPNNLPEGYLYGKIPIDKDKAGQDIFREVVYMPKPKNTTVPLVVEKGTIQMGKEGEYRIVEKAVYDKNVVTDPTKPGKLLGGDSQIHHLFADNMLRTTPFGQRALRLGAVNPDGSINLIEMAKSKQALADARQTYQDVKFSDFIHNTQHKKFDGLMQDVVDKQITAVREAKGISGENEDFIPQMTKEDMQIVWSRALKRMRRGLMGEDTELYDELQKITRPQKGSLAQGEPQDDTEVA
jgi:hypothetical protein